jgi:hypothetical protein
MTKTEMLEIVASFKGHENVLPDYGLGRTLLELLPPDEVESEDE